MRENLSGETFIELLLSGHTNFSQKILERGFELSGDPRYPEIIKYLEERPVEAAPYDFTGSQWHDLKARGLHMPASLWVDSDLDGSDLVESNFDLADFSNASVKRANLGRCRFTGGNFTGAHLERSNLEEAKLEGANFWKANLSHVIFVKSVLVDGLICEANCHGADFTDADLTQANLWGSGLSEARLVRAFFHKTQLRGAKDLEQSLGLFRGRYRKTRLGVREREIILQSFDKHAFVVEE